MISRISGNFHSFSFFSRSLSKKHFCLSQNFSYSAINFDKIILTPTTTVKQLSDKLKKPIDSIQQLIYSVSDKKAAPSSVVSRDVAELIVSELGMTSTFQESPKPFLSSFKSKPHPNSNASGPASQNHERVSFSLKQSQNNPNSSPLKYNRNAFNSSTPTSPSKQTPPPNHVSFKVNSDWKGPTVVRPPIVTIMGHVDHGKTTLLDYLRKSSVAAQEAGGITQHISVFSIISSLSGKPITFLDTPGHALFSNMRARGASLTDIIVLVVAADDGVMPQTQEVIRQAKEFHVPMIVAINKCDRPQAKPTKVREQLLANHVILEEYGGDVQSVEISALKGKGIADLEDAIVTLADVLEIQSRQGVPTSGRIVESQTAVGKGKTALVLPMEGSLKRGNFLVAGKSWAKIRSLTDELGNKRSEVQCGFPAIIDGWKELPSTGDFFFQVASEEIAKKTVEKSLQESEKQLMKDAAIQIDAVRKKRREEHHQQKSLQLPWYRKQKVTHILKNIRVTPDSETRIRFPLLVRADVSGTLEALEHGIKFLPSKKIAIQVINSSIGNPTVSDIEFAASSKSTIVAFNCKLPSSLDLLATQLGVPLIQGNVIYKIFDDLKESMRNLLPTRPEIQIISTAQVLQIFFLDGKKENLVAGCKITEGEFTRSLRCRVMRNDNQIFESAVASLRIEKQKVNLVKLGQECGIQLESSSLGEIQIGDVLQTFKTYQVAEELE